MPKVVSNGTSFEPYLYFILQNKYVLTVDWNQWQVKPVVGRLIMRYLSSSFDKIQLYTIRACLSQQKLLIIFCVEIWPSLMWNERLYETAIYITFRFSVCEEVSVDQRFLTLNIGSDDNSSKCMHFSKAFEKYSWGLHVEDVYFWYA